MQRRVGCWRGAASNLNQPTAKLPSAGELDAALLEVLAAMGPTVRRVDTENAEISAMVTGDARASR